MIAAAKVNRVDPHLGGGRVDEALHVVIALGPPCPAVRRHGHGVGEHAPGAHLDERRAVARVHVLHDVEGGEQRADLGHVGAEIAETRAANGEEPSLLVQRQFRLKLLRATVVIGQEGLRPAVGPLHGPAQRARRVHDADIFGKDRALHAERAAHVGGDEAHLVCGHVHHLGCVCARAHHALRRRPEGEALLRCVELRHRRARLHGVDDDAAVDEVKAGHMGRARERGGHLLAVAEVVIKRHVARRFLVERRRAGLHRVGHGDHRRQGVDVEPHGFRGLLRLIDGFRDDAGHGIADEAHPVVSESEALGLDDVGPAAALQRHAVGHRPAAGGGKISGGVEGENTRHGAGGLHIDGADDAMGHRRAHHGAEHLAGAVHVVGVASLPAQQRRILQPWRRLPHGELHGRQCFLVGANSHGAASSFEPRASLGARAFAPDMNRAKRLRQGSMRAADDQISARRSSRGTSSRRTPSGTMTIAFSRARRVMRRLTVSTVRPRKSPMSCRVMGSGT